jgi:hypothetical protein
MIPLSVLDLSPVTTGNSGPQALRNSIDLGRLADRLGFTRYWVAEHHNMPNIASSAPDIMIGQIAAATEHLRVGSGGVMLPNHAPLQVAERFKVLEGPVSQSHRSRPRPRAGHRPGDILCASSPAGRSGRRRFSRPLPGVAGIRRTSISGEPSVSQGPTPCRRTSRCRRFIFSARRATALSSRPMSAPASRSRIIFPISIRSGR